MKLEDYLVKKATPADHVLDPQRVADEYEREKLLRFQEAEKKANLAKPGSKFSADGRSMDSAVIDVAGPMTEERVAAPIAEKKSVPKDLTPKDESAIPPYQPAAPAAQAQAPAAAPMVQKESGFPWDRALMGATPLLVGLLTGNPLEGAQVSSKQLVDTEKDIYKREQDLASKLAQMQAKREVAGDKLGRRFVAKTVTIDTPTDIKEGVYANHDTFTGQFTMADGSVIPPGTIRAHYAVLPEEDDRRLENRHLKRKEIVQMTGRDMKKNPLTDEYDTVDNIRSQVQNADPRRITIKDEKDLKQTYADMSSNKEFQRYSAAISEASHARGLAQLAGRDFDPNSVAATGLKYKMVGILQGAGAKTDKDIDGMQGDQGEKDIAKRWLNLQKTGSPMTSNDVKDVTEVLNFLERNLKGKISTLYGAYVDSAKNTYGGLQRKDIESRLNPLVSNHLGGDKKKGPGVEWKGVYVPPNSDKETVAAEMDGDLYWFTPEEWPTMKEQYPKLKRLSK
jgi:hypothetical protein